MEVTLRPQSKRTKDYDKSEVNAMFESGLGVAFYMASTYLLPPESIHDSIKYLHELFKMVGHEHFLARDEDVCFACRIPMDPEEGRAWLN